MRGCGCVTLLVMLASAMQMFFVLSALTAGVIVLGAIGLIVAVLATAGHFVGRKREKEDDERNTGSV